MRTLYSAEKSLIENFWEKQFEERVESEHTLIRNLDRALSESDGSDSQSDGDIWIKILKRVFLFLPGAFLLFGGSSFLFHAFFTQQFGFFNVLSALPWLSLLGFMVIFGIGDIRNPKHLLLPLSIVVISFFVFLVSFLIGDTSGMRFMSYYSIYLFPLVLATPFLVKDFISEKRVR